MLAQIGQRIGHHQRDARAGLGFLFQARQRCLGFGVLRRREAHDFTDILLARIDQLLGDGFLQNHVGFVGHAALDGSIGIFQVIVAGGHGAGSPHQAAPIQQHVVVHVAGALLHQLDRQIIALGLRKGLHPAKQRRHDLRFHLAVDHRLGAEFIPAAVTLLASGFTQRNRLAQQFHHARLAVQCGVHAGSLHQHVHIVGLLGQVEFIPFPGQLVILAVRRQASDELGKVQLFFGRDRRCLGGFEQRFFQLGIVLQILRGKQLQLGHDQRVVLLGTWHCGGIGQSGQRAGMVTGGLQFLDGHDHRQDRLGQLGRCRLVGSLVLLLCQHRAGHPQASGHQHQRQGGCDRLHSCLPQAIWVELSRDGGGVNRPQAQVMLLFCICNMNIK